MQKIWRAIPCALSFIAIGYGAWFSVGGAAAQTRAAQTPAAPAGYELVWSDEFNGPNGAVPDPGKWTYDIGGEGWGNHELEFYTNHAKNADIEAGNLVITAQKETSVTAKGETRLYTSARIRTQGLFSQTYGRFEARVKIPKGEGMWPAFWMLGDDISTVGWPKCGEIDIMENIGKEPAVVHGSLHGAGHGAAGPEAGKVTADLTSTFSLPGSPKLADDFHVYAVEWDADTIRFFIDATNYATFTREQWPAGAVWPFEHKFFVILNLAVGGDWPGPPDGTTVFPQQMLVDYVRVYGRKSEGAKAER